MYLQGDLGWMGEEWVWLRGDAHWLGGPRVQHPIGQSSVTWSLPRAWIPKCGLRLQRSVKAVGRPALCVLPHLCVRGQVPVGLALGNADSRPPGGRILQSSCAVLSACALFFFFSPQISQMAPVQGGTAHLPEPKKSSSMARL